MISKSTHQPTQAERLAQFRQKAAYHPELSFFIGNQFFKQFNQPQGAKK